MFGKKAVKIGNGISVRPSKSGDKQFLKNLYHSTRNDLSFAVKDEEELSLMIEQQRTAQITGYGTTSPNAYEFILEKSSEKIGRLMIDWTGTEIRILDISFIAAVRDKGGFGSAVIASLQQAVKANNAAISMHILKVYVTDFVMCQNLGFRVKEDKGYGWHMLWSPNWESENSKKPFIVT
ncbi:MAG: hypothetical protein HQL71_13765 [Magnetococcales bacterium]|nr:hypothetical protein [Magnetococcales bacterium]